MERSALYYRENGWHQSWNSCVWGRSFYRHDTQCTVEACIPRAQTWTWRAVVPDNTHILDTPLCIHKQHTHRLTRKLSIHTLTQFCLHCDLETLSPCHWKINMPCYFIQLISAWWMELYVCVCMYIVCLYVCCNISIYIYPSILPSNCMYILPCYYLSTIS